MKKNMLRAMNRLKIDNGIRDLIRQLWKHCYRTKHSCEGHYGKAYITFKESGDGWFERNASRWGLEIVRNNPCCEENMERKINYCDMCGAGVNGNVVYTGFFQNPFKYFNEKIGV